MDIKQIDKILRETIDTDEYTTVYEAAEKIGRSQRWVFARCKLLGIDMSDARKEHRKLQSMIRRNDDKISWHDKKERQNNKPRFPCLAGWTPKQGRPTSLYQRMLAECIIYNKH